eukprot:110742-Amphidinium_carterae.1
MAHAHTHILRPDAVAPDLQDLQKFEMQLGVQVGAIWLLLTSMMFGMVTAVFASPFAIVGYIVTMPKLNKVEDACRMQRHS